ncbi:GNAT family N-acetyltransferase [Pilimelia columellifera]|uniref:N-acetyltransferase domain-containing protein n=1 Tax=Pilimelia columellifera subsp. columellifera TaxID=706583 RepID=A0ABN3NJX6_9ACTN
MTIRPIAQDDINDVLALMALGEPYVKPRTESDYWLYAKLFSTTCPLDVRDGQLAGSIIAFRSQDNPHEIYIQDVMVHPAFRRQGVATALLKEITEQAEEWNCRRIFLTSEPGNVVAHNTWLARGFENVLGDMTEGGVQLQSNYKGKGKHRAVYEYRLQAGCGTTPSQQ